MFRSRWASAIPVATLLLLFTSHGRACAQVDPAVTDLHVIVKGPAPHGFINIEIVGTVKNIGKKAFVSSKGQQSIRLYASRSGHPPVPVLEKTFTTLKAGASITINYPRTWETEAKLLPDFILQIDLDPDIYADGNPRNDDVDQSNNRRTLTAGAINRAIADARKKTK
ncbi:MAG: hypothetical protein U0793_05985 [Gemmataceae bacterium]